MSSRGVEETDRLRGSIEKQLDRLLAQLRDLEEFRGELDDGEYDETRRETMQQLEEFEQSLRELTEGNMTLVSELNSVQLAIQGAIRQAFKTPDVIEFFAKKQPAALRAKLDQLIEEKRLGRLADAAFRPQAVEVCLALEKLGEALGDDERRLLSLHRETRLDAFAVHSENYAPKSLDLAAAK